MLGNHFIHSHGACDEDKESHRLGINLLFTEQELLFSSIKASRSSDIAGAAYKYWNSPSKKATKQTNFAMHTDYLSYY